jgi:hypothetical protein
MQMHPQKSKQRQQGDISTVHPPPASPPRAYNDRATTETEEREWRAGETKDTDEDTDDGIRACVRGYRDEVKTLMESEEESDGE